MGGQAWIRAGSLGGVARQDGVGRKVGGLEEGDRDCLFAKAVSETIDR